MNLVASSHLRTHSVHMRSIPLLLAGLLCTAVALGACSSSDDDTGPPATTAPPTETTSTTDPAEISTTVPNPSPTEATPTETELTAAVESFWDLYLELGAIEEPFDPTAVRERLEERTTGAELQRLFDFLQGNSIAGQVVRGDIESSLTVLTVDDATAEVRDCYDDTTGLYRITNGDRLDTDDPDRHEVVFVLVLENGVWKVSQVRDEGGGCVEPS